MAPIRDGDLFTSRFGISRSLGGRSSINAIAGVSYSEARLPTESYRTGSLLLRGRIELGVGLAPTLTLTASRTRYRG